MAQNKKKEQKKAGLPMAKENYMLMGIGFLVIIIGFILMIGGDAESRHVYNPEVFSFRRITLAPILILIGYAIEVVAMMKKPKGDKKEA
jgi:cytochrome bd-type quinol oxidase subunit 2